MIRPGTSRSGADQHPDRIARNHEQDGIPTHLVFAFSTNLSARKGDVLAKEIARLKQRSLPHHRACLDDVYGVFGR